MFKDFCECDYSSWERMVTHPLYPSINMFTEIVQVNMNILGYLYTIGEFLPAMKVQYCFLQYVFVSPP